MDGVEKLDYFLNINPIDKKIIKKE